MSFSTTPKIDLAVEFVKSTGKNIFITGKAGTGKTTFLRNLKKFTSKRMIVVAPTGVAAINAGGVTIHSFFQLHFGPQLPVDHRNQANVDDSRIHRINREKVNIIRSLDLLVIDEISMVRADLLDAIDGVLRRFKNRYKPFGGVQLLMIGDLQQLAPIVKDDEWVILKEYYDTIYFFSSIALRKTSFVSIELDHIFRQTDPKFIELLNRVRNNELDIESINLLNQRFKPNFTPDDKEGYITLTTHNQQAQSINSAKLDSLSTKPETFRAIVKGEFPEFAYPTDFELILKEGAQVMFVKNDLSPQKQFFNGKIGTVMHIDDDIIYVQCPNEENTIEVTPLEWQNCKYSINPETKDISEEVIGTFMQYPLKLAWAITIHKSQGLTFDKAIIDAQAAFAHGQVYVALSRCRTLNGIVLSSKLHSYAIISDKTVVGFSREVEKNQPTSNELTIAQIEYQKELMRELFDFQPLKRSVDYCTRLFVENSTSFTPGVSENIQNIATKFKVDIFDVGVKFLTQIENLINDYSCVESNISLQERIKKSTTYFLPKLDDNILQSLSNIDYSTDSQELRTKAKEQIERVSKAIAEKIECLKACETGFSVSTYIDVRAKAAIDVLSKKKKSKPKPAENETISSTTINTELFNRLRKWRDIHAKRLSLPIYRIMKQNTLYELANVMPYSKSQLIQINGLGAKRIAEYGDTLIEIIRAYRVEIGLPCPQGEVFDEQQKEDTKKLSSIQVTYELFKEGKTVTDIAQTRGFSELTISDHIGKLVAEGLISVDQLIDSKKIAAISEHFEKTNEPRLKPAKEVLGDDYSYSEIGWVQKHLQRQGLFKNDSLQ